jgi:hypothetical protein
MQILLSGTVGLLLSVINLYLWSLLAKGLNRGRNKAFLAIFLVVKFVLLIALLWFLVIYLKLSPLPLLVGITLPIVVAICFKRKLVTGGTRDA